MGSQDSVFVDMDGPVSTIHIQRPETRNAVDGPTAAALGRAFAAFEVNDEARVAILTGAGGSFCSGADLRAIGKGRADQQNSLEPPGVDEAFDTLGTDAPMGPTRMMLSKPTIAAIEGHAVAGGLELALWCDLRVVAEDAVLGVFCRRVGVPLIDGGTYRLPRLVGHGRALDLILTGRPVGAAEALSIGLVDRVVPPGGALEAAQDLARALAAFPQAALRHDRLSVYEQWELPYDHALANEFDHGLEALESGEYLAGARRFLARES
jgi:enoyl-CoA hydratase